MYIYMSRLRSINLSHSYTGWLRFIITGYKQSITGCGSPRRQCYENWYKQRNPHPQIEHDFDENHIRSYINYGLLEHHNLWSFDCTQWIWFTDSVCTATVIVHVCIKDLALFQSRLNILFKLMIFIDWS